MTLDFGLDNFFQGGEGTFGPVFLHKPQDGVEGHDDRDRPGIDPFPNTPRR